MNIRTILVSLQEPDNNNAPFYDLAKRYRLKVDFRPFTHVEGISVKEFREQKISLSKFNFIIFTSKAAVDHFFSIAEQTRFEIPSTMKFFCISQTVALYLQVYIPYRKRRIFVGKKRIEDLIPLLKAFSEESFLLPCTDKYGANLPKVLVKNNINFEQLILYKTVVSDLSDLKNVYYDLLVFFTPSAISSLFQNFPDFKQNNTRIAVFGETTAEAVLSNNLRIDINAPTLETPSMIKAIELFLTKGKI